MIKVKVERSPHGIEEILITGHMFIGSYATDIVSSAVHSISFGILNAIVSLTGINPDVKLADDARGGYFQWKLSFAENDDVIEKQQLLAEGVVVSLTTVAESYGDFVQIMDSKQVKEVV